MSRLCIVLLLIVILLIVGLASIAGAETYQLGPDDDWFVVLSGDGLRPGDEVILRGGTYTDDRRLVIGHRGSPNHPIAIQGAQGERAAFQRPDARQNSFDVEG